jgi:hypothetical protein
MTNSSASRTVASELATATITASADATFYRLRLGFACLSTGIFDHITLGMEFTVDFSTVALSAVEFGTWDSSQTLRRVLGWHLNLYYLHV